MTVATFSFTPVRHQVMVDLARVRFATREQLLFWSSLTDLSSIARITKHLTDTGYLEVVKELRPAVYRLSRAGCRVMSTSYTARRFSIPVVQHMCHRNAAEIALQETFPKARFRARTTALKLGLFPSHAEHLITLGRDHGHALGLVDDYIMHPERIQKSWQRVHTPDVRFFSPSINNKIMQWRDIASQIMVFCTDAITLERHQAFIAFANMPASTCLLKPIWRTNV